jgi:hypothetical protein
MAASPSASWRSRRCGASNSPIAAESETGPPGAFPAPPEGLAGQTLGVDSGNRAAMPRRSARLELDGPEDLLLQVGRKARIHPLIVRKAGSGPLPGRVFVDREWVRVSPSRLDPDAESQVVQIEVLPQEMPRRKAVALVTVLSDDGQRRSVTLQAQRSNPLPWVAAAAALLALAAGLVLWLQQPPVDTAPPAPVSPILLVMVDPPAGRVFVGSRLVNSNGNALVSSDLTAGDSTLVRVELNGFKPWTEEVTLPAAGETLTLRPVMELTERVEWEPAVGDVEGQLPAGAAARAVNGRRSQLNGCIHDYGQLDAGATGAVDLRAYVSNRGEIVGLSFQGQGLDLSRGLTHCLRRQLRSLDLPSFGGADYAVFKDQIRYTRDAGRGDAGSGGR